MQDEYVEYSRHGTLLKGQEMVQLKSRFEEDVYINNHTVNIIIPVMWYIDYCCVNSHV